MTNIRAITINTNDNQNNLVLINTLFYGPYNLRILGDFYIWNTHKYYIKSKKKI